MAAEADKAPQPPDVTVSVTADGRTAAETCRFHTPTILKKVEAAPAGSTVLISAQAAGGAPKTLFEGTKEEAAKQVAKSVIPAGRILEELRKFTQFLLDHSDMRAVGVHAVCFDGEESRDNGFGYVVTAPTCTAAQAVMLVNCGDANIDEFVAKAKLDVPGRGNPGKSPIITP